MDPRKKNHKRGFVYSLGMYETPFMIFFLQAMYQSARLKNHFLYFWFGLSEYATHQKNTDGSELYSISTTFGEVGSKFSKNSRTLIY